MLNGLKQLLKSTNPGRKKSRKPRKTKVNLFKLVAIQDTVRRDRDSYYKRYIYNKDPNYRARSSLRGKLNRVTNGKCKDKTAIKLVGCTVEEFKQHLEAQFTEGMTWDNHSRKGWHVDHIRPCNSFDLTKPEEQHKCFHFTNLQPLWAEDNLSKADKY